MRCSSFFLSNSYRPAEEGGLFSPRSSATMENVPSVPWFPKEFIMPRINFRSTIRRSPAPHALLLIALLASACVSQSTPVDASHIVGRTWVLKSIYMTNNVEGPSPSQQKKLLGSAIIFGSRSLKACGQAVPIKSVEVHQVAGIDFLANTRVRFGEVGIATPCITEMVVNNRQSGRCFDAFPLPGQDIYIKSKDEILVDFEGVFYRALRKE
jgi:hypothetical protein